jgi:Leucine-rich repeat (LRR) protein
LIGGTNERNFSITMCTPQEQKIIDLLSSGDLAKKRLAFKFIETLDLPFDWDEYVELAAWLREGEEGIIGAWDFREKRKWFSDREEAIISVFNQTSQGIQHEKLKVWDERIYRLPNLKVLDFHSNAFDEIPKSIKQLRRLEHLNLNKNCLTVIKAELDHNSLLEHLSLGHNKIHTIHTDFSQLEQLQYLDLAGNELTKLPESIGCLSRLKHLNLNKNPLERLPKSIRKLMNLEQLSLLNTQIPRGLVDQLTTQLPNCNILYSKK